MRIVIVSLLTCAMAPAIFVAPRTQERSAAPPGLAAAQAAPARERIAFDRGWRFAFGHTSDADKDFGYSHGQGFAKAGRGAGALSARFDDSAWRAVDLPHDWAVELSFQQSDDSNLDSHGYKPIGRTFPETTIGWYRKTFDIPASDEGKDRAGVRRHLS